jgi:hypothetical protein
MIVSVQHKWLPKIMSKYCVIICCLKFVNIYKFVSDLQQVSGFLRGTPVSSTKKTDSHDITEILLKVALNTINQA